MNFILHSFGYTSLEDFSNTAFSIFFTEKKSLIILFSSLFASFKVVVYNYTGLDFAVLMAFVGLIIAEFWTGIRACVKQRKERFRSQTLGRMLLKIGVYLLIIAILHSFSKDQMVPKIFGFEINPFAWLYHMVFIAIVFQLFISWMENLGKLGYKETQTIAGLVLRKFNKWFEFDGTDNKADFN